MLNPGPRRTPGRAPGRAPARWNRVQARGNVIAAFPFLFLFVFRFSSDLAGRDDAGRRGSSPFRDPRSRSRSRFAVRVRRGPAPRRTGGRTGTRIRSSELRWSGYAGVVRPGTSEENLNTNRNRNRNAAITSFRVRRVVHPAGSRLHYPRRKAAVLLNPGPRRTPGRAPGRAPARWNRVQARRNVIAAFLFLFLFLFVFRFSSDLAGREGAGRPGSSPFRDPRSRSRSRFAVHGSRFAVRRGPAPRRTGGRTGTRIRSSELRWSGYAGVVRPGTSEENLNTNRNRNRNAAITSFRVRRVVHPAGSRLHYPRRKAAVLLNPGPRRTPGRAPGRAPARWNRVQARRNVIAAFLFLFLFLFVFRFSSDLAGREGAGRPGSSPFRDPRSRSRSRFAVHGSRFAVRRGPAPRRTGGRTGTRIRSSELR